MRGTKADYVICGGIVFLFLLVMIIAMNPARSLAVARDESRSDDVRRIMAAILQLRVDNPAKYDALLNRLNGRAGQQFMLGNGASCAGTWGSNCADSVVPDDCLPTDELFSSTTTIPIDPKTSTYGLFGTGYYVSSTSGTIEVGACGADTGVIKLHY